MLTRAVGRPGFGLLAFVVLLLAMTMVAAVAVAPNAAQVKDQWRVERALDRLSLLTDSTTSIVRFFDDIGTYPGALSHLSQEIANTEQGLCGTSYAGSAGGWGGRYAGRLYLPSGTPFPIGLVQDTLEHDATVGDQALVVVLTGVREEQAHQLELKADGVISGTLGRVRYTAADAEGLVTLRWRKPITTC